MTMSDYAEQMQRFEDRLLDDLQDADDEKDAEIERLRADREDAWRRALVAQRRVELLEEALWEIVGTRRWWQRRYWERRLRVLRSAASSEGNDNE